MSTIEPIPPIYLTDQQRTIIAWMLNAGLNAQTRSFTKSGGTRLAKVPTQGTIPGPLVGGPIHWGPQDWLEIIRAFGLSGPQSFIPPPQLTVTVPDQNFGPDVAGNAQLQLYQDGAYNFTGQFRNSNAGVPFDYSFALGVIGKSRNLYTFAHSGHLPARGLDGDTFDNWGVAGSNPALHDDWAGLSEDFSYQWIAAANVDIATLLAEIEAVVAIGGAIAKIIAIVA